MYRLMDIKAVAVVVMAVCLIAVNGKHRAEADQLQALAQYIRQGDVIRPVVVGVKGQDRTGQRVHHIFTGRFHDNVTDKTGRQASVGRKEFGKRSQFFQRRQLVKKQKIGDFIETETVIGADAPDQIFHIIAPVK